MLQNIITNAIKVTKRSLTGWIELKARKKVYRTQGTEVQMLNAFTQTSN